jgi:hypothetical protein
MAGAAVSIGLSLLPALLGGGGGGGEASVAESAKRVQDGDVQILIDSEGSRILFTVEESESPPIVFDVVNHILSGVTVIPRNGTGGGSSGTAAAAPAPQPYMTPNYITDDDLSDALSEHYTKAEIDTLLTALTNPTVSRN